MQLWLKISANPVEMGDQIELCGLHSHSTIEKAQLPPLLVLTYTYLLQCSLGQNG